MVDTTVVVKSSVIHEMMQTSFLRIPVDANFWKYGKQDIITREVMDDKYNTDNAWMVNTVVHFHDTDHRLPDDMDGVKWVDAKNTGLTNKTMVDALDKVVKKHEANEHAKREAQQQSTWAKVETMSEQISNISNEHAKREVQQQSTWAMVKTISEQMKSQQSAIEQISEKLAKIESQNTTTPSIDHNGDKLDTSATYQLLLDFDGSKVYFKYEKLFQMKSNFSTVSIISL